MADEHAKAWDGYPARDELGRLAHEADEHNMSPGSPGCEPTSDDVLGNLKRLGADMDVFNGAALPAHEQYVAEARKSGARMLSRTLKFRATNPGLSIGILQSEMEYAEAHLAAAERYRTSIGRHIKTYGLRYDVVEQDIGFLKSYLGVLCGFCRLLSPEADRQNPG